MDILEQIDAILLEDELDEGIKDLAKNTIISVLISIAVMVGGGSPVKLAVEKAHKEHRVTDVTVDQLEKLYNSIKTKV